MILLYRVKATDSSSLSSNEQKAQNKQNKQKKIGGWMGWLVGESSSDEDIPDHDNDENG